MTGRVLRASLADRRGHALLELLVALLPLSLMLVVLLQTIDRQLHELIVRHAARAAVRSAVVVLPDDGIHYGDPRNRALNRFVGGRKAAIEADARAVLRASSALELRALQVWGSFLPGGVATVSVVAVSSCLFGRWSLMCGSGGTARVSARASLPYQATLYPYSRGG